LDLTITTKAKYCVLSEGTTADCNHQAMEIVTAQVAKMNGQQRTVKVQVSNEHGQVGHREGQGIVILE
jgi:hypothetical protein